MIDRRASNRRNRAPRLVVGLRNRAPRLVVGLRNRAPRLVVGLVLFASLSLLASPADAQRRRRSREPAPPPPVELAIEPMPQLEGRTPEPFQRVVSLRASAPAEVVADRRLLRFEFRPEGSRRTLHCEHPDRPRRIDRDRVVQLAAGERWAEWIDLREYCWGRTLDALREGAELTVHYGPRRAARGQYVARVPGEPAIDHRTIGPISLRFEPVPEPSEPDPTSPVRVVLADRDARSPRAISFAVRVLAREGRTRAYVRSDHFRFRARGPGGIAFECGMYHGGGAAAADLFQRLTTRSGPRFSLDASFYCEDDAFQVPGVYEVSPMIDITQSGERWNLDTPTGTFVGAPALVRVRGGRSGYVERPVDAPATPPEGS